MRPSRTGADAAGPIRSVAWSAFNKPVHLQSQDQVATSDFVYGPDRARIRQTVFDGTAGKTVYYVGGLFERHDKDHADDEEIHYIRAGNTVAIYTRVVDNAGALVSDKTRTRYLHRDHLGSVDVITDEEARPENTEYLSYDAHGKRRQINWQPSGTLIVPLETPRGFTGHEHLDKLGLIHMNGRVYDPVLGRFLSADPTVQFPETTQGFNRYSYVLNNPLSFTDPSGFGIIGAIKKVMRKFTKFLNKYGRVLMSVAAVATCGTGNPGCAVLVAAVTSGMWTASYGGSLTDVVTQAAISAGTALAFNEIGGFFKDLPATADAGLKAVRFAAKTFAHGVVGGVSTALRGGKLGAGFLAGAFANLASPVIGNMPGGPIAQTAASAVAGGISAKLGGGKFQNGAITGAFSYLFSDFVQRPTVTKTQLTVADLRPGDVLLTGDGGFAKILKAGGEYGHASEVLTVDGQEVRVLSSDERGIYIASNTDAFVGGREWDVFRVPGGVDDRSLIDFANGLHKGGGLNQYFANSGANVCSSVCARALIAAGGPAVPAWVGNLVTPNQLGRALGPPIGTVRIPLLERR